MGLLILLTGLSEPAQAMQNDIKVLSSAPRGLTLELLVPASETAEDYDKEGTPCLRITVPGWAKTNRKGYPELPMRALVIQIPETGNVEMQVIEAEAEDLRGFKNLGGLAEGGLAEMEKPAMLRGTRVARVKIRPFQWNPETGELRYSRRIRLRIQFENPLSPEVRTISERKGHADDIYDQLKDSLILNYTKKKKKTSEVFKTSEVYEVYDYEGLRMEISQEGIYRLTAD